jgi:hypothetical protein
VEKVDFNDFGVEEKFSTDTDRRPALFFIYMLYKDGLGPLYYNGVLNPMYYEYSVNNTPFLEN